MQTATTLVHKGAMTIAVHAIRTFAFHYATTHHLQIHTDGSTSDEDHQQLLAAAHGIEATIITSEDRKEKVFQALNPFPKSSQLISRGGYFCKLELPIYVEKPFFYFDSDIVWLRHVENFAPPSRANAFSTESWSWYFGVSNDRVWIQEKIPRRVNSGFYYLSQKFPFERLERMLRDGLFDPTKLNNTDQEMMAFLYPDMEYYHPEDLKRTRVRKHYTLAAETCAALHFPGRMWLPHLDQIEKLPLESKSEPTDLRFQPPVPLDSLELLRMRSSLAIAQIPMLRAPINLYRSLRQMVGR